MTAATSDVTSGLTKVLARALRELGDAGHPVTASKLAAQAWVVVRHCNEAAAQRLAGLLHYLAQQHDEDLPGTTAQPFHEPTNSEENMVTEAERQLDVRAEAPARRHELIFEACDALEAGNAFVLVNDHDPKPLYYQLTAEHPGEFSWDYLEEGPEAWRVRIGRLSAAESESA